MEETEHLRHVPKVRDTYKKRKETIERVFADAKERHCLRYTNYRGLAKVKVQVALIFSCLNLKKMAIRTRREFLFSSLATFITESQSKKPVSEYSEAGFVYKLKR